MTFSRVKSNKYYFCSKVKASNSSVKMQINASSLATASHSGGGAYEILSASYTALTTGNVSYGVWDTAASAWAQVDVDFIYAFNVSDLIANEQYSPLYSTTFDLMTDEQIKAQMDLWISQGLSTPNIVIDLTATFGEGNEPDTDDYENILDIHNAPEYFDTYDIFDVEKYINNPLWHFIADEDDYTYWYQLWRDAVDEVYRYEFFEHLGGLTEEVYNEYLPIYTDMAPQYADIAPGAFLITEPYGYREELVPYVPPTILERIDSVMDTIGLGDFGKVMIVVAILVAGAVILALLHASLIIALIVEASILVLFIALGWIPLWLVILIVVILFLLIVIIAKSRGGTDD
jgi:hypothetical protein